MTPVSSRRRFLGAIGAVGVTGLAGCASDQDGGDEPEGPPPDTRVRITAGFIFDPEVVEIEVGDTVEWENTASPRQSVTAYEDRIPAKREYFASGGSGREIVARVLYPFRGGLNHGDRYRNTFEMAGTYDYFSIPWENNGMTGSVIVTE
ncbi:MAG: plastocyanin/azurin family copper-binding protein [Natronomonas sp.]